MKNHQYKIQYTIKHLYRQYHTRDKEQKQEKNNKRKKKTTTYTHTK